jgi:protein-tyrosine phosphatase
VRARDLQWDACLNVRDLGGLPTEDGGWTRFGAYVRADCLERLSEAGWQALADYGVRTVVDLRLDEERGPSLPHGVPLAFVHRPLVPDFGHPDWEELNALSLGSVLPDSTRLVYLEFLERYRERFGRAVSAVAEPNGDGAVLFHCMGGKDRTGLMAALLLRVAGVERDAVSTDYALSERNLDALHRRWIADAADERERELRTRVAAAPAEAMRGVLDWLEASYGGAAGYLRTAGVEEGELDRIRSRLLE